MYFQYHALKTAIPLGVHFWPTVAESGCAMFRWVIEERLAAGSRPRIKKKPTSQVPRSTVDVWLQTAKAGFDVRSIICLLDQRQLRLYESLRSDLVSYYRSSGFHVVHIPVRNYKHPALSGPELERVWKAYERLEKPVLIHCSAGIGRTGKAVSHIKRKLENVNPRRVRVSVAH